MFTDARLTEILAAREYPQTPQYLLAALQDARSAIGSIPESCFAELVRYFHADESTTARLRPLFTASKNPEPAAALQICTGAVCQRFGLLESMQQGGDGNIVASTCLGLCDQAPAALYRDEKIPHASVELLQRKLAATQEP